MKQWQRNLRAGVEANSRPQPGLSWFARPLFILVRTDYDNSSLSDINRTRIITFPTIGEEIYDAGPITLPATSFSGFLVPHSVTGPANVFAAPHHLNRAN